METYNLNNVRNVRNNHIADEPAGGNSYAAPDKTNSTISDANDLLQTILIGMVLIGGGFIAYKMFWEK